MISIIVQPKQHLHPSVRNHGMISDEQHLLFHLQTANNIHIKS